MTNKSRNQIVNTPGDLFPLFPTLLLMLFLAVLSNNIPVGFTLLIFLFGTSLLNYQSNSRFVFCTTHQHNIK